MLLGCSVCVEWKGFHLSCEYQRVGALRMEWLLFVKQKTAYEIEYGRVGSEMCIRDRRKSGRVNLLSWDGKGIPEGLFPPDRKDG